MNTEKFVSSNGRSICVRAYGIIIYLDKDFCSGLNGSSKSLRLARQYGGVKQ
ncbi:hypothetical protein SAMN05192533_10529 [Mesobacillus persicus]|uniref:Uncharacterized protein n=1 Tax=Mesobacillus persicus TaxID=930146 RepID=A0A1H8AIU0_9BACI|nr:hypothetical protein SAMN05192533_10529 [Mesobacillus persicus]